MHSSEGSPLQGRRVVVTRAPDQMDELVQRLRNLGADVIQHPTIVMGFPDDWEELDERVRSLSSFDGILLGSKNAVDVLSERVRTNGRIIRIPSFCVGAKTREYIDDNLVFQCKKLAPEVYRSEALVELMKEYFKEQGGLEKKRFLFPRAAQGRDTLIDELTKLGAEVDAQVAYHLMPADPASEALIEAMSQADAFTFFSGETLSAFFETVPTDQGKAMLEGSVVAVIGPVAAERAKALGVRVDIVPEEATLDGLLTALVKHFEKLAPKSPPPLPPPPADDAPPTENA